MASRLGMIEMGENRSGGGEVRDRKGRSERGEAYISFRQRVPGHETGR